MNLLENLNKNQQDAVITTEGPLLILAGAGSGKTRVIIHRIAHLIKDKHVAPFNIFAVTFTNKAAGEMKKRIVDLIGPTGEYVFIKTFHSASVYILRRYGDKIGIPSSFSIYDSKDQESVIKGMLVDRKIDPKKIKPRTLASKISEIKDKVELDGADPSLLCDNHFPFDFNDFYTEYQKKLAVNNALDFNDLLIKTVILLRDSLETREKLQDQWPYLMVDEYQDTNSAQYLITKYLAEKNKNLCVVGDDDQSIYSWRGADIRNILDFEQDYPDARIVKLEENYRSTKPILDAAFSVIVNNTERKGKDILSQRLDGELPVWCRANNEYGEAEFCINKILTLKSQEKLKDKDFAIFYRTNAQSRIFEELLRREAIPYKIIGGHKFFDRKEIKDILAYLKFISNPFDTVSMFRIINTPARGIGAKTLENLRNQAYMEKMSEWEIIDKEIPIGGKFPKGLKTFKEIIMNGLMMNAETPAETKLSKLVASVIDSSGLKKSFEEENTPEGKSRVENIDEFLNTVYDHEEKNPELTLEQFLQEISLLTSEENPMADENADPNNTVTLMTIHNAKGLEFPVVFLTGMEENIFPHINSIETDMEVEEERRLCYVGITRAMDRLYMTNAELRRNFAGVVANETSRFLYEIPSEMLDTTNFNSNKGSMGGGGSYMSSGYSRKPSSGGAMQSGFESNNSSRLKKVNPAFKNYKQDKKNIDNFFEKTIKEDKINSDSSFRIKQRVLHPKYGNGTIMFIEGKGDNVKLTINFDTAGVKSFLEKYTPLQKC